MKTFILVSLIVLAVGFAAVYGREAWKKRAAFSAKSWSALLLVGFGTNFFDTLGVGSFAPTTALYRFFGLVEDRLIPGTLNVGHTLPVVVQALIFITAVEVEPVTLLVLMAASAAGAVVGAGIVARLPVRGIRRGMGGALLVVALAILAGQLGWFPPGGDLTGLQAGKLVLAAGGVLLIGSLSTIGIGFYAPCMALVYLLGMSPKVAFPIMMGSCAYQMIAAGARFVRAGAYDRKAALGLSLAGLPGVLLAALVVVSLPLQALKWVVLAVILYTSSALFRRAAQSE